MHAFKVWEETHAHTGRRVHPVEMTNAWWGRGFQGVWVILKSSKLLTLGEKKKANIRTMTHKSSYVKYIKVGSSATITHRSQSQGKWETGGNKKIKNPINGAPNTINMLKFVSFLFFCYHPSLNNVYMITVRSEHHLHPRHLPPQYDVNYLAKEKQAL